jgi:hypothetical protein
MLWKEICGERLWKGKSNSSIYDREIPWSCRSSIRRLAGNRAAGLRWLAASPTGSAARHPARCRQPMISVVAAPMRSGDESRCAPLARNAPAGDQPAGSTVEAHRQYAPVAQAILESQRGIDGAPDGDEPTAVRSRPTANAPRWRQFSPEGQRGIDGAPDGDSLRQCGKPL